MQKSIPQINCPSIYEQVLQYSDNLIIILSEDLHIIDINPTALKTFHWKKNQILNKSIASLCKKGGINPFIKSYPIKAIKKMIQVISDGKKLQMCWHIIPIEESFDQKKQLLLIGKQAADFSQKEFEAMQLDNIIRYTPHLFYWKDKNSIYQGCNDEFAKLAGLKSRHDVVGKSDSELIWKDRASLYTKIDQEVLNTKKPQLNIEEEIVVSGNKIITAISNKVPLFDNNKRVIGVLGITTDITARKEMEEALQVAKEKAEAANIAKTQFLANISHDIRTPLVGIQGIAMLLAKTLPEKMKAEANSIVHASSDLLNLLNEVISLAQLETGKVRQQLVAFNLKKLFSNIVTTFQPSIKKKGLKIDLNYSDDLPTLFKGNRMYLNRIILNLVSNALKFTQKGYIRINIEPDKLNKPSNSKKRAIKFSVIDTGIGIPKKYQQYIFESFTRLNPSYEGVYKGSGLGLHITKQFVEQLGGIIDVDSEPGQGSTFTVHVKLDAIDKLTEQELIAENEFTEKLLEESIVENVLVEPQQLEIKQTLIQKNADVHGLLVEDNPLIQKVSALTLNEIGCFVDIATNGQEALQMAARKSYDIIFMDIGLPDIDGCKVSSKIRAQPDLPNYTTPIIALTAHMDASSKDLCLASGMNAVITKPLTKPQGYYLFKRYLHKKYLSKKPNEMTTKFNSDDTSLEIRESSVIDLDDGAKVLNKNHAEAINMLDLFAKSLSEEQPSLAAAFLQQDWQRLQYNVHRLYGSTCFCGVPRLRAAAKNLETAFVKNEHEQIVPLYEKLDLEIQAFFQAYQAMKKT
ncbi:MAG TPA: ATP-binding protein [Patescibacteria group bacterium]|nr:ATP-binding protein [Gammaproteobacteria bacterium]HWA51512.1 ATP-binding protein [Patescibacteria group bacterium]